MSDVPETRGPVLKPGDDGFDVEAAATTPWSPTGPHWWWAQRARRT